MSTDGASQLFYVNLTTQEQEKLELIERSVATLCLAKTSHQFKPIWIGDGDDGERMVRLTAAGQNKTTLFEASSDDVLKLPPSALYLLIAQHMRRL
jgi:hypothetical protein